MLVRSLVVVVAVAACRHVPVYTRPDLLVRHADDFAERGYARVDVVQGGTVGVTAEKHVDVLIPGNERSHLWGLIKTGTPDETRDVTVGTLVAGCGPTNHGPNCLASRAQGEILIGERRELDVTRLATGLFGVVAATMSITCLAVCSNVGPAAWIGAGLGVAAFAAPMSTVY
jgi:hypothetical protein